MDVKTRGHFPERLRANAFNIAPAKTAQDAAGTKK